MDSMTASEDMVSKSLVILQDGVEESGAVVLESGSPDVIEKLGNELHQSVKGKVFSRQTTRMAMTIIANAFTFQDMLAGSQFQSKTPTGRNKIQTVRSLVNLQANEPSLTDVKREWQNILEINYWPIFEIAVDLLDVLSNMQSSHVKKIIDILICTARQISEKGITRSHDLYGRLFQQLISDRKFLATFYTLPVSATLLAELAVERIDVDWSNPREVSGLKIGDFACGTGTLIGSAYAAIRSRHRQAGGDDANIHADMMASSLYALDILPSATHLTTSMLSSAHPKIVFSETQVSTLSYGRDVEDTNLHKKPMVNIGSLEFLDMDKDIRPALFKRGDFGLKETSLRYHGQRSSIKGRDRDARTATIKNESMDLVIMNPPYTSPTKSDSTNAKQNPIPPFAAMGTEKEDQRRMASKLEKFRKKLDDHVGHGNAGLGSNFMDLADAKLKPGGILALVLPFTIVKGDSWRACWKMLCERYRDFTVISLMQPKASDRSFSADTGMAEVLIIAKKRKSKKKGCRKFTAINIERRPKTMLESKLLTHAITNAGPLNENVNEINIGYGPLGHIYSKRKEKAFVGAKHDGIIDIAPNLARGKLKLPRCVHSFDIPICKLGKLGGNGPLSRDINGGPSCSGGKPRGPFKRISKDNPNWIRETDLAANWPVLWGHDKQYEKCMIVQPDRRLDVRDGENGRASDLWERSSSRLHFPIDFTVGSQPLGACLTVKRTLGGRAWPNFILTPKDPNQLLDWERTMVLWANTTMGLILWWKMGSLQQPGRAILSLSMLSELPVLNLHKLNRDHFRRSRKIFREFHNRNLLPASDVRDDQVRKDLDMAVLTDLLGFELDEMQKDGLGLLQEKFSDEPTIHGGKEGISRGSSKPLRPTFWDSKLIL